MGCAIGFLALFFPRITLVLVWFFGPVGYLSRPFPGIIWPILGFFFLPMTTLAYAFSSQTIASHGHVTTLGWVLVVIAVLIDLGSFGHSGRAARARRRRNRD